MNILEDKNQCYIKAALEACTSQEKEILEKIPGAKVIKSEHFYRRYQHYQFSISLIEVE